MSVCLCTKVHLNIVWKSDGIWLLLLHTESLPGYIFFRGLFSTSLYGMFCQLIRFVQSSIAQVYAWVYYTIPNGTWNMTLPFALCTGISYTDSDVLSWLITCWSCPCFWPSLFRNWPMEIKSATCLSYHTCTSAAVFMFVTLDWWIFSSHRSCLGFRWIRWKYSAYIKKMCGDREHPCCTPAIREQICSPTLTVPA